MRAITLPTFGDESALTLTDVPAPSAQPGHVVIEVAAAGVNRADLLQRQGHYPPPPGESEIPGLEVSGTISQVGDGVDEWSPGDEVCALLAGGGYAEQVAVPAGQVLRRPAEVELVDAAALPEVTCTVWSNVFLTANLQPEETLLVHGGSSGIGTMAIQLAKAVAAQVAVTAGTSQKLQACADLGADILISYKDQDFVEQLHHATDGEGAHVILDVIGAKYLDRNLDALATNGRLVIIGMQGGVKGELNIAKLLGKRAAVVAAGLRSRPEPEKSTIVAAVGEHVWPMIERGVVHPVIHTRLPLSEAGEAHRILQESQHIGKVLLTT